MERFGQDLFVSEQDEIEIVFEPVNREQTFIQSTNQAKQDLKPKDEVKLKSNQTNRTTLETFKRQQQISAMRAPIQASGQGGKAKQQDRQRVTKKDPNGYGKASDRKPLLLPGFGGGTTGPTVPTYVQQNMPPGVQLGNVTALNTDQHRFYSFNQRLLASFIPLWGSQVRKAFQQWLAKNDAPGISKSWITHVEVIMNEEGEILQVQPFRLSGTWSMDRAAIDAFKKIRTVPNPPEEMIDENGYVHLQFQTEVLYIPQPSMRFQGGGPGN